MEQKRKPWRKPSLEALSVEAPKECNVTPGWPQANVCSAQGVPPSQTSCNLPQKPVILS
jgi:hypothetical protein